MSRSIRRLAFAFLALAATFAATAEVTQQAAFEPLQGTWTVATAEQSGKPFNAIKGGVLTISGEEFKLKTAAGNELSGKLRLNTEVKPKRMDFLLSSGAVWEAIYSATGATLRLNYVEQGEAERPMIFATTASMAGTLIFMRKTG